MSRSYEYQICHYVYSESSGEALVDIEPGTTWDEIGEAFQCPHCQAKKKLFIEVLS